MKLVHKFRCLRLPSDMSVGYLLVNFSAVYLKTTFILHVLGYDLLKGPFSNPNLNDTAIDEVLAQAARLADNMAFAFDTPSGVPANNLYFNPPSTDGSTTNGIATIGSLVLEWTHLSDLTGNDTYAKLSQKGESYLLDPKPEYNSPWPGMHQSSLSYGPQFDNNSPLPLTSLILKTITD